MEDENGGPSSRHISIVGSEWKETTNIIYRISVEASLKGKRYN